MKLTIGNYEVEVKAKGYGASKMNAEDTQYFLNMIASDLYCAGRQRESEGYKALAQDSYDRANEIHDALDAKGFYNDIRKNA